RKSSPARDSHRPTEDVAMDEPRGRITRRRLTTLAATAASVATGVGLYTWRVEPHWLERVERELPIVGLPAALVGQRMVQLSDLHIGRVVDHDYVTAAIRSVRELRPAFTVVTGDFMTCYGAEQVDNAARVMEGLAPGPLGGYCILGNHDYGHQW